MSSRAAERGLFGLALMGLAILSVRPVGIVEQGLDLALLPVRLLSEAARPVGLLRMRSVRAAEGLLAERVLEDFERRQELFRAGEVAALPDPEVFTERRFVLAEVIDRDPDRVDRVTVDLESGTAQGIVEGLPVVCGEAYVGRIESVDYGLGQAHVALITGRDTFVGAMIDPDQDRGGFATEAVQFVVGGVTERNLPSDEELEAGARKPSGSDYLLAVHNPSVRDFTPGRVVVNEGPGSIGPYDWLANGFLLGRPVENGRGERRKSFGVEPLLDYRTGLFQLVVVCPPEVAREPEILPVDVLMDPEAWSSVAVTSSGDPAPWREGLKLGSGWWDGVRAGAAVVSGSYLVGRVEHAGVLWADVAMLGDPGFRVPALARIEGSEEPLVLGSLISLGRDGPSAERVRFVWNARAPRIVDAPVRVEIFTGSGELRVPRGLLLGTAELPAGEGVFELTVDQPVDTRNVRRLFVRMDRRAEGTR